MTKRDEVGRERRKWARSTVQCTVYNIHELKKWKKKKERTHKKRKRTTTDQKG